MEKGENGVAETRPKAKGNEDPEKKRYRQREQCSAAGGQRRRAAGRKPPRRKGHGQGRRPKPEQGKGDGHGRKMVPHQHAEDARQQQLVHQHGHAQQKHPPAGAAIEVCRTIHGIQAVPEMCR
ncbi:hypothetical protein GSUB_02885 [Geoalkalibacter subterraneus]|uniref:Uncharacterized protein n=1 Tax=Geoalkalibacter subterraneus TaxID=483547 RepID=A0A0B5FEI5_9BACT|nr:hypothetical protein GSUB_02885 [Geoalkalibacter subterraneus]